MIGSVAIAAAVAILLGVIINWLADQLPMLATTDEEDAEDSAVDHGSQPEVEHTGLGLPRCPHCGTRRQIGQYSGIIAFLIGRRKCERCGRTLSWRHPLVELLFGAASAFVIASEGVTPESGGLLLYLALFILVVTIDIEHRLVLNSVMLPAFVLGLVEISLTHRIRLRDALVGYAVGQIVVMGLYLLGALYVWVVNTIRREPVTEVAFGFGDVTLATFCGMVVGFPGVLYMLVLMILLGGGIALFYLLYRVVVTRDYHAHTPIAYGPAIVLAALVVMLWGERFVPPSN